MFVNNSSKINSSDRASGSPKNSSGKVKLGVSACLLGEKVRYDGKSKADGVIRDILGKHVEFVALCPEAECGMGVPREEMILVGRPGCCKLIRKFTRTDMTNLLRDWSERKAELLRQENLRGFILKSKSPSCGIRNVKVYGREGRFSEKGIGLFAETLYKYFPLLPIEDETRLHDTAARDNFLKQIFSPK